MFEDAYRREMDDLHASESLIASTLEKMKEEQLRLQEQLLTDTDDEFETLVKTAPRAAASRSSKSRMRNLVKIGLPAAACMILAVFGVTLFLHNAEIPGQDNPQAYVFQLVEADTSIGGGLQFGNIAQQPGGVESDLKRADCSEAFLPEGILLGTPVPLGGYSVYLGFDKQQATYYAAYRKGDTGDTWVLLRSTVLDETGFVKALKDYFS